MGPNWLEKLQKATEVADGLLQRKSTLEILTTKDGLCERFNQLNQVKMNINPEVIDEGRFTPSEAVSALKLGRLEVKGSDEGVCASRLSASQAGPREFVPVKVIGKKGRGNGKFKRPEHVTVNVELKQIAVTDTENCRVQIFDSGGKFLRQFGKKLFKFPMGIVYDKRNNIVVSDFDNDTVSVFTTDGTFLRNLATEGSQDGQVLFPLLMKETLF